MLSDITVLELGQRVSTGYCGKLLVDAGAEVVKLESHEGDSLRVTEPAYAAFLHAGKRSVSAAPGLSPTTLLADLAAAADAIVFDVDESPEVLALLPELRRTHPRLVAVFVSNYGSDGPLAGTPASDFTLQCEAGLALLHPTRARPPVVAGVELGELTAAASAAVGLVSALLASEVGKSTAGIDVDVSRYESLLSTLQFPWLYGQLAEHMAYPLPQNAIPGIERAKDGWVCVVSVTGPQWDDFKKMAGVPELDDKRFNTLPERVVLADEVTPLVRRFTSQHTVDELVELGALHRVPIVPVTTPDTIANFPPHGVREAFVRQPGTGALQPASPFRDGTDTAWAPGPLPRVGADNGGPIGESRAPGNAPFDGDPTLPLAGTRVIEFGTFQAGPMVGRNLAGLGADVIKVEAVGRPDLIRFIGVPMTANRSWERGAPFIGSNLGKRSLTADLSQPEGLRIVRELLASADVVLDNFLPRALDERGLDYAGICALSPNVVMVRMPAWGLAGPWRDRPGFTYSVNATSGLAELTGYPDGDPMITGTTVDPIAALVSTFVALVAIRHQRQEGTGGLHEVALCDVATQLTARAVISSSLTAETSTRLGNSHPRLAPQGVYRASDDSWIALTVETDSQWAWFVNWSGMSSLLSDPRFTTGAGRAAHANTLDDLITPIFAELPGEKIVHGLRALGVPAAPLRTGEGAHHEAQIVDRGRVVRLNHASAGPVEYLGLPYRVSNDSNAHWASASPLFGEHNDALLAELGYTAEVVAALRDAKVIGSSPYGLPYTE